MWKIKIEPFHNQEKLTKKISIKIIFRIKIIYRIIILVIIIHSERYRNIKLSYLFIFIFLNIKKKFGSVTDMIRQEDIEIFEKMSERNAELFLKQL